jgi:mono/diheme cytochrome c family protein
MEYAVDDAGAVYKAKCAMCHTATASKYFDAAKTDDELVQIVLKGKKGEKPPYMPGYEEKGITAETAKELVAHMRQLKAGTN